MRASTGRMMNLIMKAAATPTPEHHIAKSPHRDIATSQTPTAHHNGDGWSNLLATAKGEIAPSQATASGGVGSLKARTETTSGKYQHI